MSKLGEKISMYRSRRRLKQAELATLIGVQPNTIGSYETGRREPPIEKLIALADAFGVSLDELVGREYRPFSRDLFSELMKSGEHGVEESDEETMQFLLKLMREADYKVKELDDEHLQLETPSISVSFNRKDLTVEGARILLIRPTQIPICIVLGLFFGGARMVDYINALREVETERQAKSADET